MKYNKLESLTQAPSGHKICILDDTFIVYSPGDNRETSEYITILRQLEARQVTNSFHNRDPAFWGQLFHALTYRPGDGYLDCRQWRIIECILTDHLVDFSLVENSVRTWIQKLTVKEPFAAQKDHFG